MSYSTFEVGTVLLRADASTCCRPAKTPPVNEARASTGFLGHPAEYFVTRLERSRGTKVKRAQKAESRKQ
jgi:hypothetical protein